MNDKGRNRRRRERKKTGSGPAKGAATGWKIKKASERRAQEKKKKKEKSFIPCDDKGLSQSRLIACSSPLRPTTRPRPSVVATNFDSCRAYPSSRRPVPSVARLASAKSARRPFYDRTFPVSTFRSTPSPPQRSTASPGKHHLALLPMRNGSSTKIETRKLGVTLQGHVVPFFFFFFFGKVKGRFEKNSCFRIRVEHERAMMYVRKPRLLHRIIGEQINVLT